MRLLVRLVRVGPVEQVERSALQMERSARRVEAPADLVAPVQVARVHAGMAISPKFWSACHRWRSKI